jgi:hypothetical protein
MLDYIHVNKCNKGPNKRIYTPRVAYQTSTWLKHSRNLLLKLYHLPYPLPLELKNNCSAHRKFEEKIEEKNWNIFIQNLSKTKD